MPDCAGEPSPEAELPRLSQGGVQWRGRAPAVVADGWQMSSGDVIPTHQKAGILGVGVTPTLSILYPHAYFEFAKTPYFYVTVHQLSFTI